MNTPHALPQWQVSGPTSTTRWALQSNTGNRIVVMRMRISRRNADSVYGARRRRDWCGPSARFDGATIVGPTRAQE